MMTEAIIMNDINWYPYKQTLSLCLILALGLALTAAPPLARAEQTGEVTGIFNVASAPEITNISVKPHGEEDEATSLTPLQKYKITVEVSSSNTIDDLSILKVALWYDENGNDHGEGNFDEVSGNINFQEEQCGTQYAWGSNAQQDATIVWDRDGTSYYPENEEGWGEGDWKEWGIGEPFINSNQHSHNWGLESYSVPDDFSSDTFSFVFTVRISRAALKTYGDAKWQVAAKVVSQSELDHYLAYSTGESPNYGLSMNWYGGMSVPSDHTVDWGNLPVGIDFDDEDARQRIFFEGKNMTVYANGYYGRQVKADTAWDKVGEGEPESVSRTENADAENTFALRIRANAGTDIDYDEGTAKDLPICGEGQEDFVDIEINRSPTTLAGRTVSNDYMYIKLNETFHAATYSGKITFGIFDENEPPGN
jgi:hypothetical protein